MRSLRIIPLVAIIVTIVGTISVVYAKSNDIDSPFKTVGICKYDTIYGPQTKYKVSEQDCMSVSGKFTPEANIIDKVEKQIKKTIYYKLI